MRKIAVSFVLAFLVGCCFVSGVSNPIKKVGINETDIISTGSPMKSPWPMFHHDTKHTGRSPYGSMGNYVILKWSLLLNDYGGAISSPAIDDNGNLYLGQNDHYFLAINPNGTINWKYNLNGWVHSSPAIGSNNSICFGADDGNFYSLYSNGTLKWTIDLGEGWTYSSPVIDENGIIYTASTASSRLFAIYPNGTMKWSFQTDGWIYSSPAIADDGTIYIGSNDGYFYAIYPNGTLKWRFSTGREVQSPPSIGADGTIYFGSWNGYLYALNSNGNLKWKYNTGGATETSPAISSTGAIITGSYGGNICCVNPDGTLKWSFQTNGDIFSSPAIDKNNIIYCGSYDGYLYCFNLNGTLRWKYLTYGGIQSSPVINQEGIIFIASYNYFYALETINDTAPSIPTITGIEDGKVRHKYDYTIVSTDPESDNISYYIDWGGGTTNGWIGPYDSGQEQTVNHTWNKRGTYTVQVKAKDSYGAESDWGKLRVIMPKNSDVIYSPLLKLLERFFERHPFAFPILRHLLIE